MGRPPRLRSFDSTLVFLGFAMVCPALGCSAAGSDELVVGHEGTGGHGGGVTPPDGSGGFIHIGDAGTHTAAFRAHVESPAGMTVTFVTLSCAGDCADVLAVAEGGVSPYTFAWEDGSTDPHRRVCPSATSAYAVTAKDAGIASGEFKRDPFVANATLTANVLECTDAGSPPPTDGGSSGCVPSAPVPPEELTPDIFGTPTYFAGGAPLPAGRYRLAYVDGCMKYDGTWTWTVQGSPPVAGFQFQWVLIGATKADLFGLLPGTAAPIAFQGYGTYDACVAANLALPPLDFDFAGGPLAIWQNDFKPDDNIAGTRSPTWRLTSLGCP